MVYEVLSGQVEFSLGKTSVASTFLSSDGTAEGFDEAFEGCEAFEPHPQKTALTNRTASHEFPLFIKLPPQSPFLLHPPELHLFPLSIYHGYILPMDRSSCALATLKSLNAP